MANPEVKDQPKKAENPAREAKSQEKSMSENQLTVLYNRYILLAMNKNKSDAFTEKQLIKYATDLFCNDESESIVVHGKYSL